VSKAGYHSESFELAPQAFAEGVGASVGGNLLVAGGVVGLVVDGVSGAGLDKCPNPVRVSLRPIQQSNRRGANSYSPAQAYDPANACKEQRTTKQPDAKG
jgi:hypothetical protein